MPMRGGGHQTAKPDVTGSEMPGLLTAFELRFLGPSATCSVKQPCLKAASCAHCATIHPMRRDLLPLFFSRNLYEMRRRACAGVGHKHESRVSRRPGLPGSCGWLGFACFALAAIFRRVVLARFLGMIRGVQMVPVRNVGVMSSLFGITGFVMFGRFTMMMRGKLVMLGCALVMLRAFVFRHYQSPYLK
jgi:hypothetical protein